MVINAERLRGLEKALTPQNRILIERLFDATDPCSCYSGGFIDDYLTSLIGADATKLLKNIIDAFQFIDVETNLKGISAETLDYLSWFYTKYSPKLKGVITQKLLRKPDSWASLVPIGTRYNLDNNEILLKVAINKLNRECVLLEDTYGSMFLLFSGIVELIAEQDKIEEFIEYVDITKEDIAKARKALDLLDKKLALKKDKNEQPHKVVKKE